MTRMMLIAALAGGMLAAAAAAQEAPVADGPAGEAMRPGMQAGMRGGLMAMPGFAELDADGDGMVTADEITAFLVERVQARAAAMMARADADGDGALSEEEFAAAQAHMRPDRRPGADRDGERRPQARPDRPARGTPGCTMRGGHHGHWSHGHWSHHRGHHGPRGGMHRGG